MSRVPCRRAWPTPSCPWCTLRIRCRTLKKKEGFKHIISLYEKHILRRKRRILPDNKEQDQILPDNEGTGPNPTCQLRSRKTYTLTMLDGTPNLNELCPIPTENEEMGPHPT